HCETPSVGFNAKEAHSIVEECVDGVSAGEDYNHNMEQSLTHLVKLGKACKYIVTCAVVQKSTHGFQTASSCFWNTTSDGTCTIRWENQTMNCIVNIFAIAIVL
uniref:Dynein light chain Tctex-type 3 n=1 Tax=Cercocebus atys TaxID=9531 RepID=A0A2K5MJT9_CERAT